MSHLIKKKFTNLTHNSSSTSDRNESYNDSCINSLKTSIFFIIINIFQYLIQSIESLYPTQYKTTEIMNKTKLDHISSPEQHQFVFGHCLQFYGILAWSILRFHFCSIKLKIHLHSEILGAHTCEQVVSKNK